MSVTSAVALELQDVDKRFGRVHVLQGASMAVRAGEVVGLVGENGAGKTTILRIIVGLLRPDAGSVRFSGSFGYCPQEPLLFDGLTFEQNVAYFSAAYGLSQTTGARRGAELMERLHCRQFGGRRVGELSGGTQQKLNLIISLLHEPNLLLLDEPYQGLDYESYLAFWDLAAELAEQGRATLVVSHMVHDHARLSQLYRMADGRTVHD